MSEQPSRPIIPQAEGTGWSTYADDEISLMDLWAVLVRRRAWLLGVAVIVILLSAAYALLRTPVYGHRALVEIASQEDSTTPIEKPAAVAARLNDIYIPEATSAWREAHPDAPEPGVEASVAGDAGLVRLSGEGPKALTGAYSDVMTGAVDRLSEDHAPVTERLRDRLRQQRSRAERRLATARDSVNEIVERRKTLDDRAGSLTREIDTLQQALGDLEAVRPREIADSPDAVGAVQRLLDNEVAFKRQRLDDLRSELNTDLPRRRNELNDRLDTARNEVEAREEEVALLADRLDAITGTRLAAPPRRSERPQGPSAAMIVALGAVLGVMLGLFVAFGAEFLSRANAHMRET
ncbi:Wzz/FepE/Etk N-terminal domain-containing protein [Arhodomonas aquaeolei]|uniref:Wzz/FepE/Etk N-terminal domain-containing protein n=1 Tax=Arhodomonas aquaeolei TaxID=2369 RepID=UPI000374DB19|nr:Wzz/FepE/Etk N-terminal domain-containing protein [Arhodomonas aquaeolei]